MNFVLVLDRWLPRKGGLERYAAALAGFLVAAGDRVRVVTMQVGERTPGVEFERAPVPAWPRLVRERRFYARADGACVPRSGEVAIAFRHPGQAVGVYVPMGGLYRTALSVRHACSPSRWPWVAAKERLFLRREVACLQRTPAPLVLAPSALVAGDVTAQAPALAARTVVTHLAVDLERFRPGDPAERRALRQTIPRLADPDSPWLLFVGHDPWRKGLDRALAVLDQLRRSVHPGAWLLCAGRAVRRGDPARGVVALGETDPAPLYRAADVLLALSREDSFGLHVAEALASGLPVLTTPETGAGELLTSPIHGEVASGDRPATEWAAAVARFLGAAPVGQAERRAAVRTLHAPEHFAGIRTLLMREG